MYVHIHQRQNMNWPLADNFEATNVSFLPKKFASNVQSSCTEKSKWSISELWHYCIKATIWCCDASIVEQSVVGVLKMMFVDFLYEHPESPVLLEERGKNCLLKALAISFWLEWVFRRRQLGCLEEDSTSCHSSCAWWTCSASARCRYY